MKRRNLTLSMLTLFVVFTSISHAQITSKQVDQLVNTALQKFNVAGTGVAIVKDGKVVHMQGYGLSSATTKERVNEHTRFAIASNSKAFTSMALALLVDQKKMKWTDKVVEYIPTFKMYNSYVTDNFTIVDLLTHRSGLGLGAGDLMFFPDGADFTMDDVVKSFQYHKPQSDFRTKFDYDNLLYMVAGEVVKRVSGKSWSAFVEDHIMKPLGMNESAGTYERLKNKKNVASPHADIKGKLTPLKAFDLGVGEAAGGINASISDMAKWVQMHINNGVYGKKKLVSRGNHNFMWTPQTNRNFNPTSKTRYRTHLNAYGLGWGIKDMKGNMVYSHTGGLPGMLSKVLIVPEMELGIIVLTNTSDGGGALFSAVTNTILDSYLGLEDFGWTNKYAASIKQNSQNTNKIVDDIWETVSNTKNNSIDVANFTGTFKDNWFGKVKIYLKDGQLWFKSLRSPKLHAKMQLYKDNTFAMKWPFQDMNADAFAMFSLDKNGKAIGIKMKGISPRIDFSFDFQDLDLKRVKE